MDIELNVSCPNTDKHMVNDGLKPFLNDKRKWCILKLSPLETSYNIDKFYESGFRQFHASNTLPSERGGISGRVLKPYTLFIITYLKNNFKDCSIIAGGGIYDIKTMDEYKKAGADHFSVSTIFFHPFKTFSFDKSLSSLGVGFIFVLFGLLYLVEDLSEISFGQLIRAFVFRH